MYWHLSQWLLKHVLDGNQALCSTNKWCSFQIQVLGNYRAYGVITAPLMQDNITLNSAEVCEILSSSPSPSLFLISAISCLLSVWNSLKVWQHPWNFCHQTSAPASRQFHLAADLSIVVALFQLLGEKAEAVQAVFRLLLSRAIYNECNGRKLQFIILNTLVPLKLQDRTVMCSKYIPWHYTSH